MYNERDMHCNSIIIIIISSSSSSSSSRPKYKRMQKFEVKFGWYLSS